MRSVRNVGNVLVEATREGAFVEGFVIVLSFRHCVVIVIGPCAAGIPEGHA